MKVINKRSGSVKTTLSKEQWRQEVAGMMCDSDLANLILVMTEDERPNESITLYHSKEDTAKIKEARKQWNLRKRARGGPKENDYPICD